jgi:hypothetical protein
MALSAPAFQLLASPPMGFPIENAVFQWEDGYRSLEAARSDPRAYAVLGRVVMGVHDELRKRLGSSFSIGELAELYREGTDWALELAIGAAPEDAPLPDTATAVDAAFYLYMREATDFAGGSVSARQF